MGLAASQARLLTLTSRKADLEYDITVYAARKQSITREMAQLSTEYYSKLSSKQVSFYANNRYNAINYQYLMGTMDLSLIGTSAVKSKNSMILTDYKGNVCLSSAYAEILADVMGLSSTTRGGVCNPTEDQYAEMLEKCLNNGTSIEDIKTVIGGGTVEYYEEDASGTMQNLSDKITAMIKSCVDLYLPIFKAAAANGWTTEYEEYWNNNSEYISDALVSGTLCLALVDDNGQYTTDESLDYFITSGYVSSNSSSDERESITAWYEALKEELTLKENYWDTETQNTSTELESVKTEIDSVQSLIDDATEKLNWNA